VPNFPCAYIDLNALKHNLSKAKQFAADSKIFAIIKADAFAVARVDETIELRDTGIEKNIILLQGVRSAEELILASQYRLSPVFHSEYQLNYLDEVDINQPLTGCWLMLETGMHRLGINPELATDYLAKLNVVDKIVGYGDGYHRSLAETAYVDINGQLAKLVGRV
jgi:alanine racemase